MAIALIKNFTAILCSMYIYSKLLNLKPSHKKVLIGVILSTLLSFLVYYIKLRYPIFAIPAMVMITFSYLTVLTRTEPGLSITTTIISFGISYSFYAISALFPSAILGLLKISQSDKNVSLFSLCVVIIQLSLIGIPFRFRRLKSGMPFLCEKGGSNAGVLISVLLLCSVIALRNSKEGKLVYIIPIVSILLLGALILFWWRSRLKKLYIEKLKAIEVQNLQKSVEEKDALIEYLKQNNEFLAKIIHKDNKLIPSMELAVREYLKVFAYGDCERAQEQGKSLLENLEKLFRERSGIIESYQSSGKKLPMSDVFSFDSMMSYMKSKANSSGIEFELMLSASVKYLIENIISETDLSTLLADLIENAIIATKSNNGKNVLIMINVSEGYYQIDIYDSGTPFEAETIVNLGLKKTTTHADSGGSGIGLVTAFEIFKKHKASFTIDEISVNNSLFSKKLSVRFDGLDQYLVKTNRADEITALLCRNDLILEKTPCLIANH